MKLTGKMEQGGNRTGWHRTAVRAGKFAAVFISAILIALALSAMQDSGIWEGLFRGKTTNLEKLRLLLPLSVGNTLLVLFLALIAMITGRKLPLYENLYSFCFGLVLTAAHFIKRSGGFLETLRDMVAGRNLTGILYFLLLLGGITLGIRLLFCSLRYGITQLRKRTLPKTASAPPARTSGRKRALHVFGFLFLSWLLVCIIRFPAGIEYDADIQIRSFLEGTITSAKNPPFSSVLMGAVVWLGQTFFSRREAGLFLLAVVQCLLLAAVFTYSIRLQDKLGAARWLSNGFVILYAVSPTFFLWTTSLCKDIPYAGAFLLLVCALADYLFLGKTKKKLALVTAAALLFALLKNTGILILAVGFLVLLLAFFRKYRTGALAACFAGVCAVYLLYSFLLLPSFGIRSGDATEAMSVPFQQTARYAVKHPEEVTEEEKEAINGVLKYDRLAEVYNPEFADPVKNLVHGDSVDLKQYLGTWFRQSVRHPETALDATLATCYPFFDPDASDRSMLSRNSYFGTTPHRSMLTGGGNDPLPRAKRALIYYADLFEGIPVFGMLTNTAVLFWLTIYLFFRAVSGRKKGKRELFLLFPSLLNILLCIGVPCFMHHGNRYALPAAWAALFLAALCLRKGREPLSAHSRVDTENRLTV